MLCDNCNKLLGNVWIEVSTDGNGWATFGDYGELGMSRFVDEGSGSKVFGSTACLVEYATKEKV